MFSGYIKTMKTTQQAPEVCIDLVGNTTGYESVKVLWGSLVKDADRVDEGWDVAMVRIEEYPLVNIQKAIENGHRNSGFSH